MTYTVGKRKFTFKKKNLRMRNLYAEIADLSSDLSLLAEEGEDMVDSIVESQGEIDGPEEPKDKLRRHARERKKIREKYREMDARKREIIELIGKKRTQLLEIVLVKNGYEYDPEFWLDESDVEDLNNIVTGLFKEGQGGKPIRA